MDTLSTQGFGVFLDMNQWDFQGLPNTGTPFMVTFPYYSIIPLPFSHPIQDMGKLYGEICHFLQGPMSLGGPWKSHWITIPETNIPPENRPSQKDTSLPTIHFQVRTVSFRECNQQPIFHSFPPTEAHSPSCRCRGWSSSSCWGAPKQKTDPSFGIGRLCLYRTKDGWIVVKMTFWCSNQSLVI